MSERICKHRDCLHQGMPQSVDQFGKDATRSDGIHPYCRDCRSRISRERMANSESAKLKAREASAKYRAKPEASEKASAYYFEHKADYRRRERERTKRPDVLAKLAEKRRAYTERNQLKECARKAINYNIRKHRIVRPDLCQWCGLPSNGEILEAHHWRGYDPDFWLDVRFVHASCHVACESVDPADWP